jgi:hypothetical protein
MTPKPLDEALCQLGPTFNAEIRKRLGPVKDRFFQPPPHNASDDRKDGLRTSPPYMTEPELRKVATEIAELALQRGIDMNAACEEDGSTFLFTCAHCCESQGSPMRP